MRNEPWWRRRDGTTLREFLLPRDRTTMWGAARAMILPFLFAALLNWLGWLDW